MAPISMCLGIHMSFSLMLVFGGFLRVKLKKDFLTLVDCGLWLLGFVSPGLLRDSGVWALGWH